MDVLVLLFFVGLNCHVLHGLPTGSEFATQVAIEDQQNAVHVEGRSRQPRKIIRRIQNGVAFLAGVKVGTLLANKGFEAGHGSLAATNNFQLFGKSFNSAISLSYGGTGHKLPLLDDPSQNGTESSEDAKTKKTKEEDVVHVTVVRNPSEDTIEQLKKISRLQVAELNQTVPGNELVIVESGSEGSEKEIATTEGLSFIQRHNKRVMEFNKEIARRNSRF